MISVIIPLYNKGLSVKATLQSVLDQSYDKFEIVVVNDGSTDDSVKVIETFDDPRVRVIHQENKGVSAARNRGIRNAKYDWVAFIDADDVWQPGHLSEIFRMIESFPEEKVFVTSYDYSDGRRIPRIKRESDIYKIDDYFGDALYENVMWTSVVALHKSCIAVVGGFNEKLTRGEDLDLWARLGRNYSVVKSSKITAVYRVEAENRTGLTKDIEKTHVYHIDLRGARGKNEANYYKISILKRMASYLVRKDFGSFYKLKRRHDELGYIEIIIYLIVSVYQRRSMRRTSNQ